MKGHWSLSLAKVGLETGNVQVSTHEEIPGPLSHPLQSPVAGNESEGKECTCTTCTTEIGDLFGDESAPVASDQGEMSS